MSEAPSPERTSRQPPTPGLKSTLGLVLALGIWAALALRADFVIDDAFISLRYARNWAEHGVAAYHPGSAPPVEGYSNFLWVLLLRGAYSLGLPLEGASRGLGYACAALTLVLTHRLLLRSYALGAWPAALGTLALAVTPGFCVWTTGGLETALFTFLLLTTHALLSAPAGGREARRGVAAGLCGVLLAWTRVEGFLWVLGVALCALPTLGPRRRRRLGPYFGVYLAGFGAFLLWRHAVYGEWLANTVRAKAGFSSESLLRGLRTDASWLLQSLAPAVALFVPLLLRGRERRRALGLAGLVLGALAYNAAVGGDWMPFFRFLAPAAPFVALLLGLLAAHRPRVLAGCAVALLAAAQALPQFDVHLTPRPWRAALDFRSFRAGYQTEWERHGQSRHNLLGFRRIGLGLAQVTSPGDSLTFGAIGAVGWHAPELVIHDRNGLVDPEVAALPARPGARSAGHDKRVPRAWFLHREPTLFHAIWLEQVPAQGDTAALDQAARQAAGWVFSQGGEQALRGRCLPRLHPLEPVPPHLPGGALLVLEAVDDAAAARAYWDGLLGPE